MRDYPNGDQPHRLVLLIEDDDAIAEMYALDMSTVGLRARFARDGGEGLDMAAKLEPDVICLDIGLPDMDGLDVLRALLADPATKEIPVIVVSNYGEQSLVDTAKEIGAVDYLIKAEVTPRFLTDRVASFIEKEAAQAV